MWLSCGFHVVFMWLLRLLKDLSRAFLWDKKRMWFSCGFHVVFMWFSCGFCGFSKIYPAFFWGIKNGCGFHVAFMWFLRLLQNLSRAFLGDEINPLVLTNSTYLCLTNHEFAYGNKSFCFRKYKCA